MPRFKNIFDGYRAAKKVYLCDGCGTYYDKAVLALMKIKNKPSVCFDCGCSSLSVFDSEKEFKRYCELVLHVKLGMISDLKTQQPFECKTGDGLLIEKYIADSTYVRDGRLVVEDVKPLVKKTGKPFLTPAFRRKQKWMRHVHHIDIEIYF